MAIELVGRTTGTATGGTGAYSVSLTGLTGGLASSPSEGDLVVVCAAAVAGSDLDLAISGYTEVVDIAGVDNGYANLGLFYKFMGSTPDTSVSAPRPVTSSLSAACAIHVWRGVDPTTPIDVAAQTAIGSNAGQPNPPSITPVTSGAVILAAGVGTEVDGLGAVFTTSDLSNFSTVVGNSTFDVVVGMGSKAWTSGAFNPAAFGGNASAGITDSWSAVSIALRPASGGKIKVYDGASWVKKPVKWWNGSAWVEKPVKRWNGSSWVALS